MVCSGSPSLHAILNESASEDDSSLKDGGSSGFPIYRGCNMVTPAIPIMATRLPEDTPALQTIPAILQRTTVPQPNTGGLLLELLWVYQDEHQCAL
jgi:hypothetical protein